METKELFEKWKATATYSQGGEKKREEDSKLGKSTEAFFAANEEVKLREAPPPEPLSEKYQRQFKTDLKTPGM
jgi:hypothetical protein